MTRHTLLVIITLMAVRISASENYDKRFHLKHQPNAHGETSEYSGLKGSQKMEEAELEEKLRREKKAEPGKSHHRKL